MLAKIDKPAIIPRISQKVKEGRGTFIPNREPITVGIIIKAPIIVKR